MLLDLELEDIELKYFDSQQMFSAATVYFGLYSSVNPNVKVFY